MRLAFRQGNREYELGVAEGHWSAEGSEPLVDLRSYWALPGLADCHAHLASDSLKNVDESGELSAIRRRAFAQMGRGVFLIVDKGWSDEVVLKLIDEPPDTRPHLEAAGRIITGTHGYFPGFAEEVDDSDLPQAVARANKKGGWVKLVGDWPQKGRGPVVNFGEEALKLAVEVAHAAGARVAIHAMAPNTPAQAVRAGVDSIEHGLYLSEADLALLGERRGAWVPTIANTEDVLAAFSTGSTAARVLGAGLERLHSTLPLAASLGVSVLAGTDLGLRHGEVAAEAIRLAHFGLPTAAAVDAASINAYEYLGMRPLEFGTSADVVLFAVDPSSHLQALSEPVAGMRAGRIVFDHVGAFPDFVRSGLAGTS
jgi:imidazolonepropionase-like amidohydrolase